MVGVAKHIAPTQTFIKAENYVKFQPQDTQEVVRKMSSDSEKNMYNGRKLNAYQVRRVVEEVCRLDDVCAEKFINIEYCISNQEVKDILAQIMSLAVED